jgi:hypothetical protein
MSPNEINLFKEADRIAELAAREGVKKAQLEQLSSIAKIHPKEGVLYWLNKQTTRGLITLNFRRESESLLSRTTSIQFSKTMAYAKDLMDWKTLEPLEQNREVIYKIIDEYETKSRKKIINKDLKFDKNRGPIIEITFERGGFDMRQASYEIKELIKSRLPDLRSVWFNVWINVKEVRK